MPPRSRRHRKALQIRGILAHPREAVTNRQGERKCAAPPRTTGTEPKGGATGVVEGRVVECPLVAEGGHVDTHRMGSTDRADAPVAVPMPRITVHVEVTNEKVELLSHGEAAGEERIGHRGSDGTRSHTLEGTDTRRIGPFLDE